MLYIIGLGLNENSISQEGLKALQKCEVVYLENYTVDFPYSVEDLEKTIGKKINNADRELVEGLILVNEAKKQDIALLVYGSPLTATTHISLIQEAQKQKVEYEIMHNASVLDAVAETGLQLYKFGKITSMPKFEADSFIEIVKENQKINAHSLILVDIGLKFEDAIGRLERVMKEEKVNVKKIVVCEKLGTKSSKIYYSDINRLRGKSVNAPFCFILPSKLHFMEEEILNRF